MTFESTAAETISLTTLVDLDDLADRRAYRRLAALILGVGGVGTLVSLGGLLMWYPAAIATGLALVATSTSILCLSAADCLRPLGIEGVPLHRSTPTPAGTGSQFS